MSKYLAVKCFGVSLLTVSAISLATVCIVSDSLKLNDNSATVTVTATATVTETATVTATETATATATATVTSTVKATETVKASKPKKKGKGSDLIGDPPTGDGTVSDCVEQGSRYEDCVSDPTLKDDM